MERYYSWADYLKGEKYIWVPLNVGKRLGLKKVNRMAAAEYFPTHFNIPESPI